MHYTGFGARLQKTPQSEPIPGSGQVANNAGGFSWSVDDMTRFQRFAILGASGGTYYIGERKLVKENLQALENLLKAGRGLEVVQKIVEISDAGRGVSNDPALFALARCCAADDKQVSRAAYDALPKVARTGTHLLHFMEYVKQFRGRGRQHRRALKAWYNEKRAESVAYQVLKYQSRDGWSQRDVLRLARPKPVDSDHNAIYRWITKGWESVEETVPAEEALRLIWAFERAKHLSDDNEVADLILKYGLPREAVPTTSLKSVKVWEALLEKMPLEAVTRNLATMTRNGVLVPMGKMTKLVCEQLRDVETIKRNRLHPIKILSALTTYAQGHGVLSSATWTPIQAIIDALNDAFYLAFASVEPTGKRILISVDVSGSMWGSRINSGEEERQAAKKREKSSKSQWSNPFPSMSCAQGAAALALVTASQELNTHIIGFESDVYPLPISPRQRLDDVNRVMQQVSHPRGTDCSLPFLYAIRNNLDVDAVIEISDSETWQGSQHPIEAKRLLEKKLGHAVKAINIQMTATHVSNFDPEDRNSMECTGFDTMTPEIINSFLRGDF